MLGKIGRKSELKVKTAGGLVKKTEVTSMTNGSVAIRFAEGGEASDMCVIWERAYLHLRQQD